MPGTRKLGKTTDQRMAMLRQQVTDLLDKGRMETTVTRAKEIAPLAEKMITLGKAADLASYRQMIAFITREDAHAPTPNSHIATQCVADNNLTDRDTDTGMQSHPGSQTCRSHTNIEVTVSYTHPHKHTQSPGASTYRHTYRLSHMQLSNSLLIVSAS